MTYTNYEQNARNNQQEINEVNNIYFNLLQLNKCYLICSNLGICEKLHAF